MEGDLLDNWGDDIAFNTIKEGEKSDEEDLMSDIISEEEEEDKDLEEQLENASLEDDPNFFLQSIDLTSLTKQILEIREIKVENGHYLVLDEKNFLFFIPPNKYAKKYSLPQNTVVTRIFLSPNAHHVFAVAENGEVFYINSGVSRYKPKKVSALRGISITSVLWNGIKSHRSSVKSTGIVLLGTKRGRLFQFEFSVERKKKVAPFKLLMNLNDENILNNTGNDRIGEITSLELTSPNPGHPSPKLYLLVSTPFIIFEFFGGPQYEDLFASFENEEFVLLYKEVPRPLSHATPNHGMGNTSGSQNESEKNELHLCGNGFAWLCSRGIYHGRIDLDESLQKFGHSYIKESEIIVQNMDLFGLGEEEEEEEEEEKLDLNSKERDSPILSIAINRYHIFVLYEEKFVVYLQPASLCSNVSQRVEEEGFEFSSSFRNSINNGGNALFSSLDGSKEVLHEEMYQISISKVKKMFEFKFNKGHGQPLKIIQDDISNIFYLYSANKFWRLDIDDLERDVWKLYLERAQTLGKEEFFDKALNLIHRDNIQQKNTILISKAEYLFDKEQYDKAAKIFAQTTKRFEEIAMKFFVINPDNKSDLITYLTEKLKMVKKISSSSSNELNTREGSEGDPKKIQPAKTQICCILTWITELYLNQLNTFEVINPLKHRRLFEKDPLDEENRKRRKETKRKNKKRRSTPFGYDYDEDDDYSNNENESYLLDDENEEGDEEYDSYGRKIKRSMKKQERKEEEKLKNFLGTRKEFYHFLKRNKDYLSLIQPAIFQLLSSHSRPKELVYFAILIEKFDHVLNTYITSSQYEECLGQMKRYCMKKQYESYWYKYIPILFDYIPERIFHTLKESRFAFLKPSKFLPCLMKYISKGQKEQLITMDYLSYVIEMLKNKEMVIHNLLLYLFTIMDPQVYRHKDFHFLTSTPDSKRKDKKSKKRTQSTSGSSKKEDNTVVSNPLLKEEDEEKINDDDLDLNLSSDEEMSEEEEQEEEEEEEEEEEGKQKLNGESDEKERKLLIKEEYLLNFLKRSKYYNNDYALRLCLEHHRVLSYLHLCLSFGMNQEAVEFSLKENMIDKAKDIAESVKEVDLKRSTWLRILKYIIEQNKDDGRNEAYLNGENENLGKAVEMLKELNQLNDLDIRLEDILPFFPNDLEFKVFKKEIILSLKKYTNDINQLKSEMKGRSAELDSIKKDMKKISSHHCYVHSHSLCEYCKKPILSSRKEENYYIFPCYHMYHQQCLLKQIEELSYAKRRRISELKEGIMRRDEHAKNELELLISSECPLCGSLMIDSIDNPLFSRSDDIPSWSIQHDKKDVIKKYLDDFDRDTEDESDDGDDGFEEMEISNLKKSASVKELFRM